MNVGIALAISGTRHPVTVAQVRDAAEFFHLDEPIVIYVGDQRGADTAAVAWAREEEIGFRIFRADWKRFGKPAGPLRNAEVIADAECLLALPCVHSKGTIDCIKQAVASNLPVYVMPIICNAAADGGRKGKP